MINKSLFIYILAFITLFLISLTIFGSVIINFNFLLGVVSYMLFSIQFTTEIEEDEILINEIINDTTYNFLYPHLNHPNIEIRKYYRNEKIYKYYFCLYLIIILFPIYLFFFILQKTDFGNLGLTFFLDCFLVELIFKLKKNKILKTEIIIENNKKYNVTLFLDGRQEYRYNGKLHREVKEAVYYDDNFCLLKKIEQGQHYIHGKKVSSKDFKNELNKDKIKKF